MGGARTFDGEEIWLYDEVDGNITGRNTESDNLSFANEAGPGEKRQFPNGHPDVPKRIT